MRPAHAFRAAFWPLGLALIVTATGCGDSGADPAAGGSATSAGQSASGGNATGGLTSGGTNAAGNSSVAGATSMAGSSAAAGSSGGPATGGSTSAGAGAGGSATAGGAGAGGTPIGGTGGASGGTPATGGSGGGANGDCPADALFCSGFEDAALPDKATYKSNQQMVEIVLDKTVHHGGSQSVKVNKGMGYVYRMLSVPAASKFWFRAYMMTDVAIDASSTVHESFMGANWGMDKGVDIVQEQCQVAVNINDNPVLGSNGMNPPINCPADGQKMEANKWYCFEGSFDGGAGDLEIFVDGKSIIKGAGVSQAKQTFTSFLFGYVEYNGTNRTIWYDDVATGPSRIPCQ